MKNDSNLNRLAFFLGLPNPKLALLLPLVFLVGGVCLAIFLPKIDDHVPGGAPVVQIVLEIIWLCIMSFCFLGLRRRFRQKYGDKAYQQLAIRFFIPAGILMVNGIVRSIWVLGEPLDFLPLRLVLGLYAFSMGILLEMKGIHALGADRAAFVYTVFPEKGTQVESALYQFLRHPLYAAMTHMSFGLALFAGTWEGLLCSLIFGLKLLVWSKIEEKELVERFGEGYLNYRKRVPAFVPKLRSIHLLLQFLLDRR